MARSSNQKLKCLYLLHFLLSHTDDEHTVTISDMVEELGSHGIRAERKSLYDDLEALRQFGLDVNYRKSPTAGYFVGSRRFQLAELKILVDAVQCSKFITQKKSAELIKKLEQEVSLYEARALRRQVFVQSRVKTMNESIYYNVDALQSAIGNGREITFRYFDWDLRGEKSYRRGGERYRLSPFALLWEEEKYYLVGYDDTLRDLRHFRVDKMERITETEEPAKGRELFRSFDPALYSRKMFGMFGGDPVSVRLRFPERMANLVFDRFGRELILTPLPEEQAFLCSPEVVPSPQFFGWLAGLGPEVRLLSPEPVVRDYTGFLREILSRYP